MKKPVLFLLMAFLPALIFAQRRNAQLGIKGGVNLASYNGVGSDEARVGFHVGLLAHIHTSNPKLAIQPEVVYSSQGADFPGHADEVDYINVPILLQYIGRGGLRLETGPQVGALVAAKYKDDNGVEYNNKNSFKQSDLSWAFGLGFISTSGFGLDLRYNLGLSDITKGRGDVKNSVWQFGIFYQFRP